MWSLVYCPALNPHCIRAVSEMLGVSAQNSALRRGSLHPHQAAQGLLGEDTSRAFRTKIFQSPSIPSASRCLSASNGGKKPHVKNHTHLSTLLQLQCPLLRQEPPQPSTSHMSLLPCPAEIAKTYFQGNLTDSDGTVRAVVTSLEGCAL